MAGTGLDVRGRSPVLGEAHPALILGLSLQVTATLSVPGCLFKQWDLGLISL